VDLGIQETEAKYQGHPCYGIM